MSALTIYHNSRCSKSRQALDILHHHHLEPIIIEYLKTPLNFEQLLKLRSHFDLSDFVRTTEPIFKSLRLTLDNEQTVLEAILKEPILMQRPIITFNNKAIIARSPETILALINSNAKI